MNILQPDQVCSRQCYCYTMNAEELAQPGENSPLLGSSSRSSLFQNPIFDNLFDKIWLTTLAVILLTGLSVGIYLLTIEDRDSLSHRIPPVIKRNLWNAETPTKNISQLSLPAQKVLLVYTHTQECYDKRNCISELKNIQNRHIHILEEADILYNFVVGGDGRIYEGRGWEKCGKKDNYIVIAILGDFKDAPPKRIQKEALKMFLNVAVASKKIIPCYQILVDHQPQRYLHDLMSEIENNRRTQHFC